MSTGFLCLTRSLLVLTLLSLPCHSRANLSASASDQVKAWVNDQLALLPAQKTMPLRVTFELGKLDARMKLAPCDEVQPFLPEGTVLWGRTRIGLRCVRGESLWRVFLPLHVRAFGKAWVVQRYLPVGTLLAAGDAAEAEVEWTAQSSPVVAEAAGWIGQGLVRPALPGTALRQSMLRPVQVFPAGTKVKLVVKSEGFSITSEGQSLAAGVVGQTVRVRLASGKIVSGEVQEDATVAIKP